MGTAQAKNIDEVGTSEAGVIKKKTAAMDKGLFAQVGNDQIPRRK